MKKDVILRKSNEVAKEEAKEVVVNSNLTEAWGAEEVEASDIRIPKILLQQAISQAAMNGIADAGDLIDSITMEKLGNAKTLKKDEVCVEFVPIYMFKTWVKTEEINGKFEYHSTEAYTSKNSSLPREEVVNGSKMQNNLTYNVLSMLTRDLGKPEAFPYMLSFARMSSNTGKDIFSFGQKAQMVNKPVCIYTIRLGAEILKNDKGTFFVSKVRGVSETKDLAKYIDSLKTWHTTFKSGKAIVDESDILEATEVVPKEGYKGEF